MNGRDVTDYPPEKRDIGFVFQQYGLFPHMSVYDNLAFPLRLRGLGDNLVSRRVKEALEKVGMSQLKWSRPGQLSGGEKQRVAIMRSVIYQPSVLLLDEPFSALDQHLVERLQTELWTLRDELHAAMILVTHDCPFAMSVSDRILVLKDGRIEQMGTPRQVFELPRNKFVAAFMGSVNLIAGRLVDRSDNGYGTVELGRGEILAATLVTQPRARDVVIAVRPDRVRIDDGSAVCSLVGVVKSLQYRGSDIMAEISLDRGTSIWASLSAYQGETLNEGETIACGWHRKDAVILSD
jgi:ABC-type Fe3+/spermidine/putrescine transport system ATPase subunit